MVAGLLVRIVDGVLRVCAEGVADAESPGVSMANLDGEDER